MPGINLIIPMCLLWVFLRFVWRSYRLDKYRQDLFEVRHEFFQLFLDNQVPFDHPAFECFWRQLNASIRYGHRTGLLNFVLCASIWGMDGVEDKVKDWEDMWAENLSDLPPAVKERVVSMRKRAADATFEQLTETSIPLSTLLLLLKMYAVVKHVVLWCRTSIESDSLLIKARELIDSRALMAQGTFSNRMLHSS